MNQYEFGTSDVLIVEEQPIPIIEDSKILIKGIYTSINYADIKKRIGNKGEGNFPITSGLDIAGIAEESKSKHFKKGVSCHSISYRRNICTVCHFTGKPNI